uniref:carbonic anhydrase n=1 Tax=Parascaris equorum TaxID=6256 RepID=A0A914R526_PAREQ
SKNDEKCASTLEAYGRWEKVNNLTFTIIVEGSQSVVSCRPSDFLPMNRDVWFRYTGSLTTPPCSETVIWTIFAEPIYVDESQVCYAEIDTQFSQRSLERGSQRCIYTYIIIELDVSGSGHYDDKMMSLANSNINSTEAIIELAELHLSPLQQHVSILEVGSILQFFYYCIVYSVKRGICNMRLEYTKKIAHFNFLVIVFPI